MSEALKLVDEASGLAFGVALVEVIRSEVSVKLTGLKHVPDRAEHGVLHRADRFALSAKLV